MPLRPREDTLVGHAGWTCPTRAHLQSSVYFLTNLLSDSGFLPSTEGSQAAFSLIHHHAEPLGRQAGKGAPGAVQGWRGGRVQISGRSRSHTALHLRRRPAEGLRAALMGEGLTYLVMGNIVDKRYNGMELSD